MFILVLSIILLTACVATMVFFGVKAVKARGAQPATVSASTQPAAVAGFLFLLAILATLGVKWAAERRKRFNTAHGRR